MPSPSAPTRTAKRTVAFSIATSCLSFAASHMLADQAGVHSPFAGAAATSNKAPAATIGFQGRRILHSHVCGNFPVKRNDIYDKIPRQAPTRPATDLVRVDGYRDGKSGEEGKRVIVQEKLGG